MNVRQAIAEKAVEVMDEAIAQDKFDAAYVTDRELLLGDIKRERRLLISLLPMDVASGTTSLETLGALIGSGVECRVLPDRPRLHAKVYIFGAEHAVVTSANLTGSAFDSNIEVGAEVKGAAVKSLTTWFDKLWKIADLLTVSQLAELQRRTAALRQEYIKLKKRTRGKLQVPKTPKPQNVLSDKLQDLFANAERFFVCNTDRRQGERTLTGGYALEQEMYNRGLATAWESFKFPSHMKQVDHGDAIFMFAKGVGIIGVGVAEARYETLPPDDADRLRNFSYEENTPEWRVPVQWLAWTDEAGAFRWNPPNFTFWNVTGSEYADFREDVKTHFLGDK